jgi:hypothetical protein
LPSPEGEAIEELDLPGIETGRGLICNLAKKAGKYIFKKPKKGTKGKEGSTDIPSWAEGQRPREGESGRDFAKRLMDEKTGGGTYDTGPGSEFNKLKEGLINSRVHWEICSEADHPSEFGGQLVFQESADGVPPPSDGPWPTSKPLSPTSLTRVAAAPRTDSPTRS